MKKAYGKERERERERQVRSLHAAHVYQLRSRRSFLNCMHSKLKRQEQQKEDFKRITYNELVNATRRGVLID
jgi:hypothetical protein